MSKLKLKIKKTVFKRKIDGATLTGYVGRVISNGKVSFDDIARASAKNTTLHPKEASLAAELLLEGVCEQIKQGMIVDLGPLGTLYPAVNGPWKQDAEELALTEFTPKVNYKPSTDIDAAVKGATMAWTTEAETESTATPTEEPTDGDDDVTPGNSGDGELTGD